MNTRIAMSTIMLAVLSLGACLVPLQAAQAEKPARIEARQEDKDARKEPRQGQGRAQSRPVKQPASPPRTGSTPGAHREERGPGATPAAPPQGRQARGGPAPRVPVATAHGSRDDRQAGRSSNDGRRDHAGIENDRQAHSARNDYRPPATYVPNRDHGGGSRQPYDSYRYRYADARHDDRYSHTYRHYPSRRYYYPPRGYVAPILPRNVVVVRHRYYNYWYGGGVWYRPYGTRYVVVAPPVGVFVSVLPSFYSTLWFGGVPYYYANDAYYVWREPQRAYEVVAPPPGAATASVDPVTEDIFVYPREGQGEEQVAYDRYECHRWASDETGFDPTQPWGGVSEDQAGALRDAYLRAMTACLEGRGYTVR
jgi:hypothetical protein